MPMKIEQAVWKAAAGWDHGMKMGKDAQMVLVFGGSNALKDKAAMTAIKSGYPKAHIFG
jgi:hypothetical protein